MNIKEKQVILTDGFNECMKHHTCGNYISMSDEIAQRVGSCRSDEV